MGLLLAQRKQEHLGEGDNLGDLVLLLHATEVPPKLLLAIYVLPPLAVFGEGLLPRFMPILIEAPFSLITDMLSKDGLKGPEASGCFHIAHDAQVNMVEFPRWSQPPQFPSCSLWTLAYRLPSQCGSCQPVAEESGEVQGLGRVIFGESPHLPMVPADVLLRQEAQGPVPGSRDLCETS